jgi:hypothetical protein
VGRCAQREWEKEGRRKRTKSKGGRKRERVGRREEGRETFKLHSEQRLERGGETRGREREGERERSGVSLPTSRST